MRNAPLCIEFEGPQAKPPTRIPEAGGFGRGTVSFIYNDERTMGLPQIPYPWTRIFGVLFPLQKKASDFLPKTETVLTRNGLGRLVGDVPPHSRRAEAEVAA